MVKKMAKQKRRTGFGSYSFSLFFKGLVLSQCSSYTFPCLHRNLAWLSHGESSSIIISHFEKSFLDWDNHHYFPLFSNMIPFNCFLHTNHFDDSLPFLSFQGIIIIIIAFCLNSTTASDFSNSFVFSFTCRQFRLLFSNWQQDLTSTYDSGSKSDRICRVSWLSQILVNFQSTTRG